jgi:hypothetical protein
MIALRPLKTNTSPRSEIGAGGFLLQLEAKPAHVAGNNTKNISIPMSHQE